MINQWIQELKKTGNFLKLTLENPNSLPEFDFFTDNNTRVEIWETGFICLTPPKKSFRNIVLSSGIHGNETAPIELCQGIIEKILTGQIEITERVLFIFGNPPAINAFKREVEENLNTLFSGNHSKNKDIKNKERTRGELIEKMITRFFSNTPTSSKRYLYDLHTAIRGSRYEKFAIYPYTNGKAFEKEQFDFLHQSEVQTVLFMKSAATTLSYYGSNTHNALSLTIELGKVRPFGENEMSRFEACRMTLLKLVQGQPIQTNISPLSQFQLFDVKQSIPKLTEKFELLFPNDLFNFTSFPVGTLIARDENIEYKIESEGDAIVFPNPKVAIGHRAMWIVSPRSADSISF